MITSIKYNWICIDHISLEQFEGVVKTSTTEIHQLKIFSLCQNEEIQNWAQKNGAEFTLIKIDSSVLLCTAAKGFKFKVPRVMYNDYNFRFLIKPSISTDNYLKGGLLALTQLTTDFEIGALNASVFARELYWLFQKNIFYYFEDESSHPFAIGNAWDLDCRIINKLNLRKNRFYSAFFNTFLPSSDIQFDSIFPTLKLPITSKLYHPFFALIFYFKKTGVHLYSFINVFVILKIMIVFRLKRRFGL